jgi:DNA-binding response OmpR family regulator
MSKWRDRRATTAVDRRARQTPPEAQSFGEEVIVVEDDRALAEMIAFALQSPGRVVRVYHDGVQALADLVALPDADARRLVLLSVDLGGIDGHTVHERLQALRPGSFIVAFMSARASEADQVRALRAGAVDYLVKPVSIHVLVEKVRVWLARARA